MFLGQNNEIIEKCKWIKMSIHRRSVMLPMMRNGINILCSITLNTWYVGY